MIRFDISLRIWAYVCREAAWDPDFNTAATLLMLLTPPGMPTRYAKHFLKHA